MANVKTLRKRIALAAAAAVGVGILTAAPSFAFTGTVASVATPTTGTVAVGSPITVSVTTTTSSVAGATTDTVTITPTFTTKPAGSAFATTPTASTLTVTQGTLSASATAAPPTTAGVVVVTAGQTTAVVSSVNTYTFTPDVPGSYVLTVTPSATGSPTPTAATFTVTATFTTVSQVATDVTSLSLAQVTAAPVVGSAVTVNAGAATVAQTPPAGNNVVANFTGYLSSYPVGAFTQTSAVATATGTTTLLTNTLNSTSGATLIATGQFPVAATFGNTVAASSTTGFGSFAFTPTLAGTYVLTVWNDANKDGVVNIGEAVQTISITVAAAAAYSNTLSTAVVAKINNAAPAVAGVDDVINASKTVGTQVANVKITLLNTAGAAINGETVSATIAGPGLIAFGASATTTGTARATSSGVLSGNTTWIGVNSDGTAGTSTLTISVTDATSGATTVLATKTFTFYGAVASLKAVQNDFVIGVNGATSGTNSTTANNLTFATTPAVVVTALDANGNVVPGVAGSISGLSSNTAVIQSVTTLGEDATTNNGGPGHYNSAISSAVASTSGQSATVTFRYTPDAGVTYINAAPLTFTLGGTPATVTFALDSATYAPGAKATLTVTAKDSAGNPVADGTYANLLAAAATSNAATQGTLPGVSVTTSKGIATSIFYAPVSPVAFTITGTLGTSVALAAQGTTVSASATVKAAVVDTSAADAATAAAKAASAAVAALSVTVASLIASVTAQLRALTIIVKKIQAKLKIK